MHSLSVSSHKINQARYLSSTFPFYNLDRRSSLTHLDPAISVSALNAKPLTQSTSNTKARESLNISVSSSHRVTPINTSVRYESPSRRNKSPSLSPISQRLTQRKTNDTTSKKDVNSLRQQQKEIIQKISNIKPVNHISCTANPSPSRSSTPNEARDARSYRKKESNEVLSHNRRASDSFRANHSYQLSTKNDDKSQLSGINSAGIKSSGLDKSPKQSKIMSSNQGSQATHTKKPSGTASLVMQNVYCIKNKPKSLLSNLTPISRQRNTEANSVLAAKKQQHQTVINNPKDQSFSTGQGRRSIDTMDYEKIPNMGKRTSDPFLDSTTLEAYNSSSYDAKHMFVDQLEDIEQYWAREIGIANIGSEFDMRVRPKEDVKEKKSTKNTEEQDERNTIDHLKDSVSSERMRERDIATAKGVDLLDRMLVKREKWVFIRLLEMVRQFKLRFSQLLELQEFRKKSLYFYLWEDYVKSNKKSQRSQTFRIERDSENIETITSSVGKHSDKLIKKHGRHASMEYDSRKIEEYNRSTSSHNTQSGSLQQMQKALMNVISGSQGVLNKSDSKDLRNKNTKTISHSYNNSISARFQSMPTQNNFRPSESIEQNSFMDSKGEKAYFSNYQDPELAQDYQLDQSFGYDNNTQSSQKLFSAFGSVIKDAQQNSRFEDSFVDQVLTYIPQPVMNEQILVTFESPKANKEKIMNKEAPPTNKNKVESNSILNNNQRHNLQLKNLNISSNVQAKSHRKPQEQPKDKSPKRIEAPKTAQERLEAFKKKNAAVKPAVKTTPRPSHRPQQNEQKTPKSQKRVKEPKDIEEVDESKDPRYIKAMTFRRNQLVKYGNRFIKILEVQINRKTEAADYFRMRNLLRLGFIGLSTGILESFRSRNFGETERTNHEEEDTENVSEEEIEKMARAELHYRTSLMLNVFNGFIKNFLESNEENDMYDEYRRSYLKRQCFIKWFEMKPTLREEKVQSNSISHNGAVQRFRSILAAEKNLKDWKLGVAATRSDHKKAFS